MNRSGRGFCILATAWISLALSMLLLAAPAGALQLNPNLFSAMRWRLIGPFRAGRVTAVAGIPGKPAIYYMGTPGGGVWKTTDGGRVWKPIFDDVRVASIGAIAVSRSNPSIIYVGTGEQTNGNGMYKSTDAGVTWTHLGLEKTHVISSVLVDPRNPDIVLVGAAGAFNIGPHSANASETTRGVFKSEDGGKTWKQVLTRDKDTGVYDLCFDPGNSQVVYAALWHPTGRFGPAQGTAYSGIYKSEDEGATWKEISGHGLPEKDQGRIGVAVAPGHNGQRVFAVMSQGLFRSEDGGTTWQQITKDPRILGNGYFSRVFVDPMNPDVVYVVQTSMYRSTDGGKTFAAYVGAPSGDDFHILWIDPTNDQRMILGVDQGAIVSVDGGETWNSWYNQPTGQFYHISTSNTFPYLVFAAQQDSGTVAVPNLSAYGEISFRDWFSVAGFEDGYIESDSLNPNLIYSDGWYGTVFRFDRTTGQYATVFERGSKYRTGAADPLEFSPQDPRTLYLGTQMVLKTQNGGASWQEVSPDLTLEPDKDPKKKPQKGLISTLALSPVQAGVMWVGTGSRGRTYTGLIQLSQDGGAHWTNVTPAGLPTRAIVNIIDASSQDAATAYAAVTDYDGSQPLIYRSHDYGKSWTKIVNGLPAGSWVRVVRADPVRKGLLYAGTMTGVYVSFDDGDHWQSLQLNLPTATVTDLTVHGNDLAASTFGRALWVLDDLTPLRQASADVENSPGFFYHPETAWRVRWDNNEDTPLPRETPAGKNPPDGAILDYYLKSAATGEVTMKVLDDRGNVVRQYSSTPPPPETSLANAPTYWFARPAVLSKNPGENRFVWDLRYPDPPVLRYSYYGNHLKYAAYTLADHAIPGETPVHQPPGPLAVPGDYIVVLTVNGQEYRQRLNVKLDPGVHTSQEGLERQLSLFQSMTQGMKASFDGYHQVAALREALTERQKAIPKDKKAKKTSDAAAALLKKVDAVENGKATAPGFGLVNRNLARLAVSVESADIAPVDSVRASVKETCDALAKDVTAWQGINTQDLPALNAMLANYQLAALPIASAAPLRHAESSENHSRKRPPGVYCGVRTTIMEILVKKFLLASALFVLSAPAAFATENPWVGRWKPNHAKSNFVEVDDSLIISAPSAGVMRWEYPAIKFTMEGKPDGSEMSLDLPSKAKGLVETVTLLTPTKLTYSVFIDGKIVQQGTDELSAGGKTLTATSWMVGKESEKRIEVFDKQ
ncbi:MAG: hypothetical protein ACRD3T_03055 [Terriglobia bacterium]